MQAITVHQAQLDDASRIAPLFDRYRQFYQQAPAPALALDFIRSRLQNTESVIFLAEDTAGQALGFCQLYPTFCSIAAARIYVLYDLFVSQPARKHGVGQALMQAAEAFGKAQSAAFMTLMTATDNTSAQALYEAQGWQRECEFYVYNRNLDHCGQSSLSAI